jgi:hypothetical protein
MMRRIHRLDEEGPGVLKIRDEAHADDADRELHPSAGLAA